MFRVIASLAFLISTLLAWLGVLTGSTQKFIFLTMLELDAWQNAYLWTVILIVWFGALLLFHRRSKKNR